MLLLRCLNTILFTSSSLLYTPMSNSHRSQNTAKISQAYLDTIKPYIPEWSSLEEYLSTCLKPLKKSITINTDRVSVEDFLEMTSAMGWTLTPEKFSNDNRTYYIDREDLDLALWRTFLYQCGFFYIQEVAASIPATLLECKPWEVILDMAAAPGGKASQIATRVRTQADKAWEAAWIVIANDIASSRIKTLAHNLNMQSASSSAITKFNGWMFGNHLPEFFDHVLVDAPCSGEWTGFKSDHALTFWKQEEINKIAWTQFQLLVSASKATKPWGTIIFSTCTLNPYENEIILARVLEFFKWAIELEPVDLNNVEPWIIPTQADDTQTGVKTHIDPTLVARFWPQTQWTWGFFVSKIRKLKSMPYERHRQHKLLPKNQFSLKTDKALQKNVAIYLRSEFGIEIDPKQHFFIASKEKVSVVSPTFMDIQQHLHCEKAWVPILTIDKKLWYRPMHYLGQIFGDKATKNTLEFSDEQMQDYTGGSNNLKVEWEPATSELGYVIITRRGYGMSVSKPVQGYWKNKFGK